MIHGNRNLQEVKPVNRLIAVIVVLLALQTFVFAADNIRDEGKEIGKSSKAAGKELKKTGKEVGQTFKELGKEIGSSFKELGKDVKEGVKGKE
jgi:hypothetical protein